MFIYQSLLQQCLTLVETVMSINCYNNGTAWTFNWPIRDSRWHLSTLHWQCGVNSNRPSGTITFLPILSRFFFLSFFLSFFLFFFFFLTHASLSPKTWFQTLFNINTIKVKIGWNQKTCINFVCPIYVVVFSWFEIGWMLPWAWQVIVILLNWLWILVSLN